MNDRFDFRAARLFDYGFDCLRMIVNCRLIQSPRVRFEIDTRAPIFQPNIVALLDKVIDDRRFHRRPKDIRANSGAVYKQDRMSARRIRAADVNEIAFKTVTGSEWNNFFRLTFLQSRLEV